MARLEMTGYENLSGVEYVCTECGADIVISENYDPPMECPNCGCEFE